MASDRMASAFEEAFVALLCGSSLIRTPLGQKVSGLMRCPHFRGCKPHACHLGQTKVS